MKNEWDDLWASRKKENVTINPDKDPIYLIIKRVISSNPIFSKNPKIVELGCGQGLRTTMLAKEYEATPVYIDSSQEALDLAKRNYLEFFPSIDGELPKMIQADVLNESIQFTDVRGDLVWSAGLNEHFFGYDRQLIFDAHRKVAKNGGYVLVIVPNAHNVFYRFIKWYRSLRGTWPFGTEQPFTPTELKYRMEEAGLFDVQVGGIGAYLAHIRWFNLGSPDVSRKLSNPTPFEFLNRWLIKKDLDFNSRMNKWFGREIFAVGRK